MSTTNLEHNELIKCDLCNRRYNINVYQRHRNENQCIKRNHHRLPFESIKQRSIQIGDQIFSVQQQQQQQQNNNIQIANNREKRKQSLSNNKQYQEKLQRILPSNNRQRILEQAKQLLERRTKYQPPWIQKRSNFTKDYQSKLTRTDTTVLQAKDSSNNTVAQGISPKKLTQRFNSRERSSPPTTKFKNDDLPIEISSRRRHKHTVTQQPVLTDSPKIRTSQASTTSKCHQYQSNQVDQTFSHEQTNSASRSMRKAYTWTRSSKQPTNRDVISPIQIPTFCESSSGPSHDRVPIPFNENYDDDEFERYSPTPPSTPKYQQDKFEIKNFLPSIKQNFILNEQQTMIRPNTYQKTKRSDQQQQNKTLLQLSSNQTSRKNTQSTFHLPPIKPSSYSKIKHRPSRNPTPWR